MQDNPTVWVITTGYSVTWANISVRCSSNFTASLKLYTVLCTYKSPCWAYNTVWGNFNVASKLNTLMDGRFDHCFTYLQPVTHHVLQLWKFHLTAERKLQNQTSHGEWTCICSEPPCTWTKNQTNKSQEWKLDESFLGSRMYKIHREVVKLRLCTDNKGIRKNVKARWRRLYCAAPLWLFSHHLHICKGLPVPVCSAIVPPGDGLSSTSYFTLPETWKLPGLNWSNGFILGFMTGKK